MNIKHFTLLAFWGIINISCNNSVENEIFNFPIDTVKINFEKIDNTPIEGSSIEIEKLISLETTDESLIGQIAKMKLAKDRIFILDNEISKKLVVFDAKGKFLYKIGTIGGGPGEFFRAPLDFSIDKENNLIYAFEAESKKIVIFDWNGKFLKEIRISKKWPYAFSLIYPDNFAFAYRMQSNKNEFSITDSHEKEIFSSIKLNNHLSYTVPFPIFENEGNIYFTPNLSNLLCKIEDDKITNAIFLDFDKHNLPKDLKIKMQKDFDPSLINEKYVMGIQKIIESDTYFSFYYYLGRMRFLYIKNKKNNHEKISISLFNCLIPTDINEIKNDKLIIPITSTQYEIYNDIKRNKTKEFEEYILKNPTNLINLLDTISESANPTICILKIINNNL